MNDKNGTPIRRGDTVRVPDGRTGGVAGYDPDRPEVLVRFSDHGQVEAKRFPARDVEVVR